MRAAMFEIFTQNDLSDVLFWRSWWVAIWVRCRPNAAVTKEKCKTRNHNDVGNETNQNKKKRYPYLSHNGQANPNCNTLVLNSGVSNYSPLRPVLFLDDRVERVDSMSYGIDLRVVLYFWKCLGGAADWVLFTWETQAMSWLHGKIVVSQIVFAFFLRITWKSFLFWGRNCSEILLPQHPPLKRRLN